MTLTKKAVNKDSTVTIHFSLTLADGTPVDGTLDGEPMTFKMGDGAMIPPFEELMLGLAVGEKQQAALEPRETFGFPDDENKHWLEKDKFNHEVELQEGLMMEFSTPGGDMIPGVIQEIEDEKVLVDFNHPLAGHEVVFSVEIVDIR